METAYIIPAKASCPFSEFSALLCLMKCGIVQMVVIKNQLSWSQKYELDYASLITRTILKFRQNDIVQLLIIPRHFASTVSN